MYTILGTDQKQYGPVSAEQINQWIAEGRANANTLARADGTTEWKALAAFPEFAAALAAKGGPPPLSPPPPASSSSDAAASALEAQVLGRDYSISAGDCISRSWTLLTQHFWLLLGASFVIGLVQGAIPLLWGPLQGGLFLLFLKLIRGEKAEFGDAFCGFSKNLLQLFLGGLVIWVLTVVGFVFCILPGIYLAVAWLFALPLIIDKNLDFWPAMEASRRIINKHWWQLFGLLLLNILVCILGILVCCVGVYVAIPITIGALAYAYEDVFGKATTPATHPL